MQLKQNPFSLYDFLGYFIPGAFFILSIVTWILYEIDLCSIFLSKCQISETEWKQFELAPSVLITSIVFAVCAYIIGFSISLLSSFIVERYLILRKGYPSKFRFKQTKDFFASRFNNSIDYLCVFLSLPIGIFDYLLGRKMGLDKSYYKTFKSAEYQLAQNTVEEILKRIGFDKFDLKNCDFNWHKYIYHYLYEHGVNHSSKIQNYVALYGFSRTTSMVFVILFWVSAVAYWFNLTTYSLTAYIFHLSFFALLAYSFFLGFTKFYRRYTDEIFMAAIVFLSLEKGKSETSTTPQAPNQ